MSEEACVLPESIEFSVVVPVTVEVLQRARQLLDDHATLMARDALHASVVFEHGLEGIYSFDTDFDVIDGLKRQEP